MLLPAAETVTLHGSIPADMKPRSRREGSEALDCGPEGWGLAVGAGKSEPRYLSCGVLLCSLVLASTPAAVLEYSTYYGGPAYEGFFAVEVDREGSAIVAGGTTSTNAFPTLNALQSTYGGGYNDGVFAKFNREGQLLFASYFGGISDDFINAVALDLDGNIIIAGETRSVDLPTTEDAFQRDYGGGTAVGLGDGFIARISADGSELLYCSYFGGSQDDSIAGLAFDSEGNLFVVGQTASADLPVRNGFQSRFAGGEADGFAAKFDKSLTRLLFSTYIGGGADDAEPAIAVDRAGFIYLAGQTLSTDFPVTLGAFRTTRPLGPGGGAFPSGYVAKLSPDGATLAYSTYIGDKSAVFGIAVDDLGGAFIVGAISPEWNPHSIPLGFQPTGGSADPNSSDAWVGKLKPDGADFEWFSFLGGSRGDAAHAVGLDNEGNLLVTGRTESRNFPTRDALQSRFGGGSQDAFVSKVSADGKRLLYSTYLGGSDEEWVYRVAPDPFGNVIAVGQTASRDFPVLNAWQSTNATTLLRIDKPADAYVVKISPAIQQPKVHLARSGNNVLISWPTEFAEFSLEWTEGLPGAETSAIWQAISSPPIVLGNQNTSIERIDATNRFYRLKRP